MGHILGLRREKRHLFHDSSKHDSFCCAHVLILCEFCRRHNFKGSTAISQHCLQNITCTGINSISSSISDRSCQAFGVETFFSWRCTGVKFRSLADVLLFGSFVLHGQQPAVLFDKAFVEEDRSLLKLLGILELHCMWDVRNEGINRRETGEWPIYSSQGVMDYLPMNLPRNKTPVHIFPPTIGEYAAWQICHTQGRMSCWPPNSMPIFNFNIL